MGKVVALVINGVLLFGLASAALAAHNHAYSDRIGELYQRGLRLSADIENIAETMSDNDVQRLGAGLGPDYSSLATLACLSSIKSPIEHFASELKTIQITLSLAEVSVSPLDRRAAMGFTRLLTDQLENMTPLLRKSINDALANCPQSVIVNQKSQEALSYFSESDTELNMLSAKIGHSSYAGNAN